VFSHFTETEKKVMALAKSGKILSKEPAAATSDKKKPETRKARKESDTDKKVKTPERKVSTERKASLTSEKKKTPEKIVPESTKKTATKTAEKKVPEVTSSKKNLEEK